MLLKKIKTDKLDVEVYSSRPDMGKNAAVYAAGIIKDLLSKKDEINMIFAAAPSQNEFLASLIEDKDIDWSRINAFHMDEYIGLSKDAPQGFGNFLKDKIFGKVPFKEVNYINSEADAKEECARYGALLSSRKIDMVCMGIGENGHIAFNDPHVAKFDDKEIIKVVDLDEMCRQQQVNDGCFKTIDDVPKNALTLTIPTMMSADYIVCIVPASTKAEAVFNTVRGKITEQVPATALRMHDNAVMYTDSDSAARILFRKSAISDEISQDFEVAAQLAVKYGLEALEIRSVNDKQPDKFTEEDIKNIKETAEKYGLKICAVSPAFFKCSVNDAAAVEAQYELLEKNAKVADSLGAKFIRGFTFWAKDTNGTDIIPYYKKAIEILEKYDKTLVIELDPSVNASNGESVAAVVEAVNSPRVKGLWDPGNDIYDPKGEVPYPYGYEKIKDKMVHMHIKDAKLDENGNPMCVAIGTGAVGFAEHLTRLLEDGYDGFISLETHYRKTQLDEKTLALPGGAAFSDGGYEASEECLICWNKLISDITHK